MKKLVLVLLFFIFSVSGVYAECNVNTYANGDDYLNKINPTPVKVSEDENICTWETVFWTPDGTTTNGFYEGVPVVKICKDGKLSAKEYCTNGKVEQKGDGSFIIDVFQHPEMYDCFKSDVDNISRCADPNSSNPNYLGCVYGGLYIMNGITNDEWATIINRDTSVKDFIDGNGVQVYNDPPLNEGTTVCTNGTSKIGKQISRCVKTGSTYKLEVDTTKTCGELEVCRNIRRWTSSDDKWAKCQKLTCNNNDYTNFSHSKVNGETVLNGYFCPNKSDGVCTGDSMIYQCIEDGPSDLRWNSMTCKEATGNQICRVCSINDYGMVSCQEDDDGAIVNRCKKITLDDGTFKEVSTNLQRDINENMCDTTTNTIYNCSDPTSGIFDIGVPCGEGKKCYASPLDPDKVSCVNSDDNTGGDNIYSATYYISIDSGFMCTTDGQEGVGTVFGCIPITVSGLANKLLPILFGIAGGISFLRMVLGFIMIATSSGDEKKFIEAKSIISSAIIGLLVSIFAIFLFRLIFVNILQIPGLS